VGGLFDVLDMEGVNLTSIDGLVFGSYVEVLDNSLEHYARIYVRISSWLVGHDPGHDAQYGHTHTTIMSSVLAPVPMNVRRTPSIDSRGVIMFSSSHRLDCSVSASPSPRTPSIAAST